MTTVTADELRKIVSYDPDTGVFVWLVDRLRSKAGSVAGSVWTKPNGRKYLIIVIGKRNYYAHRLAWLYVHGEWPTDQVDHIDGNGLNNAISNLRAATAAENCRNRGANSNNKTGLKGVHLSRPGKWRASLRIGNRLKHLGYFSDPAEAHAAYCAAAAEAHGEFARGA